MISSLRTVFLLFLHVYSVSSNRNSSWNSEELIDTVADYQALNFEVPKGVHGWLWTMEMEERYLRNLPSWRKKPLKVFVVPFSHNDAGWLETFESYYEKKTRHILDHVAEELPKMPGMKFVWSEICFLQRWWDRTTDETKEKLRMSIKRRQLEILTGGWVMPDEATTHIYSLLDQLIEGHQWLKETLDLVPESSWSIDPFGLSSTMPYLLVEAGVDRGLVIQRVHYAWKRFLGETANLDLVWRQDFDPGSELDLPLRVQHGPSYSVTSSCGPASKYCPQFDFNAELWNASRINFSNIRRKTEFLLGQYGREGSMSRWNAALITIGDDFRFENATEWWDQYRNYLALFDYINSNRDLFHASVHFSTPRDYFNLLPCPKVKLEGDFFVYSDIDSNDVPGYWSGYYTTRPFYKRLCRKLESELRSTEILYTISLNLFRQMELKEMYKTLCRCYSKLVTARRALAIFQHHDAVTGTARAAVTADYGAKLTRAFGFLNGVQVKCLGFLLNGKERGVASLQTEANFLDDALEYVDIPTSLIVYNSLGVERVEVVRIRTARGPGVRVTDWSGRELLSQIVPIEADPRHWAWRAKSEAEDYEVTFFASLPPLSISVFLVEPVPGTQRTSTQRTLLDPTKNESFCIKNSKHTIVFDPKTGLPMELINDQSSKRLTVQLGAYRSAIFQSGAYLFRPEFEIQNFGEGMKKAFIYTDGPVYTEVVTSYTPLIVVRTRLYKTKGPMGSWVEIVTSYDMGKPTENLNLEIFLRFKTDLKKTDFYTDVNGFQFRRRKRLWRVGTGGNYYPMTGVAFLEDERTRLSLVADHSHGVASLEDGEMEVMLDRRTTVDDNRGLEEGVMDSRPTVSRFAVQLGPRRAGGEWEAADRLSQGIMVFTAAVPAGPCTQPPRPLAFFEGGGLATGVHLLNLRSLGPSLGCPSSSALLVLHDRRSTGPRLRHPFLPCTSFSRLFLARLARTTLTGTKELEPYDDLDEVRSQAMRIISIKTTFR